MLPTSHKVTGTPLYNNTTPCRQPITRKLLPHYCPTTNSSDYPPIPRLRTEGGRPSTTTQMLSHQRHTCNRGTRATEAHVQQRRERRPWAHRARPPVPSSPSPAEMSVVVTPTPPCLVSFFVHPCTHILTHKHPVPRHGRTGTDLGTPAQVQQHMPDPPAPCSLLSAALRDSAPTCFPAPPLFSPPAHAPPHVLPPQPVPTLWTLFNCFSPCLSPSCLSRPLTAFSLPLRAGPLPTIPHRPLSRPS